MSTRHRQRRTGATSAMPEERERRKAEHRKVRRGVNQALHVASLTDDHDGLVLELPHPTHGYADVHDDPRRHDTEAPQRRLRHWKQSFWKRRTNDRRARAAAYLQPGSV